MAFGVNQIGDVHMYRYLALLSVLLILTKSTLASSNDPERAQSLAQKAMLAGMRGDDAQRTELLASAIELDPDCTMANWALGRVRADDEWVASDQYENQMKGSVTLDAYDEYRQQLADGKLSEIRLADWCRKKRLLGREKFHLENICRSENTSAELKLAAAQRLGMQNIGGVWMSREQTKQLRESIQTAKRNAQKWRLIVQELRDGFDSNKRNERLFAIEKFQSLADKTSIDTIEAMLSSRSASHAKLAVKVISNMRDYEATESLVRHAVYADAAAVRAAAMQRLRSRDRQDTIPLLMAQLSNPLEVRGGISVGPDGLVRRTHEVMERGREENVRHLQTTARGIHRVNQVQVLFNRRGFAGVYNTDDLLIQRKLAVSGSASWERRLLIENEMRKQFALRRQALIRQEILRGANMNRSLQLRNQQASVVNTRAMTALKTVTEESVEPETAESWWTWWNKENERYQEDRPTYTRYVGMSDPVRVSYAQTKECFPAGTQVRTQTGLRNIEWIRAGDRVLSQNTETGELSYKLILATTKRPPTSLVSVDIGGVSVEATRGHLFWVEKQGWKMAKNLKPDDLVHGLHESRRVATVESRNDAEAYNLVVQDFGNYFVGESGILVHDNSERRRSNSLTPGVAKASHEW